MCVPCSANKCRIRESDLQAACLYIIFLNWYSPRVWLRHTPCTRFEVSYFCVRISLISRYYEKGRLKPSVAVCYWKIAI